MLVWSVQVWLLLHWRVMVMRGLDFPTFGPKCLHQWVKHFAFLSYGVGRESVMTISRGCG